MIQNVDSNHSCNHSSIIGELVINNDNFLHQTSKLPAAAVVSKAKQKTDEEKRSDHINHTIVCFNVARQFSFGHLACLSTRFG